ncbi:MAG: hypothetical protein ISR65_03280 [Bacteriovoracaceae bacterium]|nr:hypothetical protein [Bacteriovoracaceae bacterium]
MLYDIHEQNLEIVHKLAQNLAQNVSIEFKKSHDLDEVVANSQVILNSTRPGGLAARKIDESLPLEFGIPGQETVGPGGFFFAIRSVPQVQQLADAIVKLNSECILLNYTNPTNIVTQSLLPRGIQVVGLCDQSDCDLSVVSKSLGKNHKDLQFKSFGLNHAAWYTQLTYERQRLSEFPEVMTFPDSLDGDYTLRYKKSKQLVGEFNQVSSWPSSYLTYYYYPQEFVEMLKREKGRAETIMEKMPSYYEHFKEEAQKPVADLRHHRGGEDFGDMAVTVLKALISKKPQEVVLNLALPEDCQGLHKGTVFESNVLLSQDGISFQEFPEIPKESISLLSELENYQLQSTLAVISKNEQKLIDALALNPLVGDQNIALNMWNRAKDVYAQIGVKII